MNIEEYNAIRPSYYNDSEISCIDAMVSAFGREATAHFCKVNAFKYIWRLGNKDNESQEIGKIKWYLDKYLELKECNLPPNFTEDYDTYFKGVDRIKEGADCIAVLKTRVECGAITADATIVSLKEGESVVWEAYEINGDLRLKRQDSSTVYLRQENANLFDVIGIAKEADLKKKGLTQRQIKDILHP